MTARLLSHLEACVGFSKHSIQARVRLHSTSASPSDTLGTLHQAEHKSFRIRKDGNARALPLPPVLDPVVLSERARWKQPKAQSRVENFTPFQKKLWETPYAHVLASPVRQCRSTFLLLPDALQITLHPRPHPETSDPWLLPVNLTTTSKHLGPPYRFLGRKLVAQQLSGKRGWQGGIYSRIIEKLGRTKVAKIVWREDMAELILSLLRKNLLNKMRWHFKQSGQLVACPSPRREDIEEFDDVSSVLYFDTLKTSADKVHGQALASLKEVEFQARYWAAGHNEYLDPHVLQSVTHFAPVWYRGPIIPELQPRIRFPPLELTTTSWRDKRVAVYSLEDLLGKENMIDLVTGSRFEGSKCVVWKRGRHNVNVEMMLLQLQAYLAIPGP